MSMDADELYVKEELKYVIDEVEKNDHDYSACQMLTYYREPKYILDPPETYYVALIQKIIPNRTYEFPIESPVSLDPTRRVHTDNFRAFTRDEIQMHHMSYVRNDLHKKLFNSSAKVNWENKIPEFISHWENWKYGDKALLPGAPPVEYNIVEVEELFSCSQ